MYCTKIDARRLLVFMCLTRLRQGKNTEEDEGGRGGGKTAVVAVVVVAVRVK